MDRYVGKIAEYGSKEFEENQAVITTLESGISINPHGITRKIELYHMSKGYKMSGSCASWVKETWGVKIYFADDNTTGGQRYLDYDSAKNHFDSINTK